MTVPDQRSLTTEQWLVIAQGYTNDLRRTFGDLPTAPDLLPDHDKALAALRAVLANCDAWLAKPQEKRSDWYEGLYSGRQNVASNVREIIAMALGVTA